MESLCVIPYSTEDEKKYIIDKLRIYNDDVDRTHNDMPEIVGVHASCFVSYKLRNKPNGNKVVYMYLCGMDEQRKNSIIEFMNRYLSPLKQAYEMKLSANWRVGVNDIGLEAYRLRNYCYDEDDYPNQQNGRA